MRPAGPLVAVTCVQLQLVFVQHLKKKLKGNLTSKLIQKQHRLPLIVIPRMLKIRDPIDIRGIIVQTMQNLICLADTRWTI
ncbi:hypothetical protein HMPREF9569_01729 [Cutibacterium acnes HL078PA1]|nr:hypothetical protein HMPREF9569_01729 [Cutibacterium acnes HL078PA1]